VQYLDLFLKYSDEILVTYKRRKIKHLKHVFETLTKTTEKCLKIIANIRNMQIKRLQTYI
jgi:hypothetical protein